ncbi:uridine kinase [Marinomonas posidonica]|uniref:uridine kinase n=1 Tax=Marinomonas posidonica TaxID=936476 RepID=UPI003734D2AB
MPRVITSCILALFVLVSQQLWANTQASTARVSGQSELFGLPFNNLKLSDLGEQLKSMGVESYPSYQDGMQSYSLGPEGILGVTDLTIQSNESGYLVQALLSGVVKSSRQRRALGDLLLKKYGTPSSGRLDNGLGDVEWRLKDYTKIHLNNTSVDVSVMYVDERPKVIQSSGRIDVESLSRNN